MSPSIDMPGHNNRNDPEGSTLMRLLPDSTPRAFAIAFRYRYAFAVVLVGAVLALHPAPPRLFGLQAYPVDAILCGDSLVWINRGSIERHFSLVERRVVRALWTKALPSDSWWSLRP